MSPGSDGSSIQGLAINSFTSGIYLSGSSGNTIRGNFIGTDVTGTAKVANSTGIFIVDASNNIIGGSTASDRNIISGNDYGIYLLQDLSTIGTASNNQIEGNYIGTDATGIYNLGNGYGIIINGASNNTIGGTAIGASNLIAGNGSSGVWIATYTTNTPINNRIQGNSIFGNGELGIDLIPGLYTSSPNGVTPNDPGDADTGANNLQNFPILTSATSSGGNTIIQGTLNSTANTSFRLEFFANSASDPSGFGEGQTYLGFATITTDASGNATINSTLSTTVPTGQYITSTATDPNGNTSEFSFGAIVNDSAPTPTVNLSVSPNTASEAGKTAITVTATASSSVVGDQTVNLNLSGTGITADDFTGTIPTQITIPNGQTTGSFTINVNDDTLVEGTETATFAISAPSSGIALGNTTSGSVTIDDNDAVPVPEINVTGNGNSIVDGDTTPVATDNTDYGSTTVGTALTRTFTIENTGTAALTLGAPTLPTGFSVIGTFPTSVAAGTSTNITVQMDAATAGTYTGEIVIPNNDSDENPYNFAIAGTVNAAPLPEVNVTGNGNNIVDGDTTPSTTDNTDYGSTTVGTALTRTFAIENTGTAALTLGTPTLPTGFSVVGTFPISVAAGTSQTITVQLDAATAGTYTGEIVIPNNDSDENPYNFAIQGTVNAVPVPEVNVTGNGNSIIDGDTTPSTTDNTDYGSTTVGTALTRTFTIENTGTAALTLGTPTLPTGFSVVGTAPTSVAAGTSTTITVRLDATATGTYTGEITIPNNDSNENPYNFAIVGVVNALPGGQVINGTNASETLTGNSSANTINALAGNDFLDGRGGNDSLNGGNGSDTLDGGPGIDTLDGGNGSDTYLWFAGDGRDVYQDTGTTGTDRIIVSNTTNFAGLQSPFNRTISGIDRIESDLGDFNILGDNTTGDIWDFLGMSLANATIQGRGGDDNISGSNGAETIQGGEGNDSLSGNGGGDLLDGGNGNDSLKGGNGNDTLDGGVGIDTLDGGNGGDTYLWSTGDGRDLYQDFGISGTDRILVSNTINFDGLRSEFDQAISEIDRIESDLGAFNIRGDDAIGDDWDFTDITLVNATIQGRGGNDTIAGSSSADIIQGGEGSDLLLGAEGADNLSGGNGNDTLNGGTGNDTLAGGGNADTFSFNGAFGIDTILDFQSGSDKINLTAFALGKANLDINGDNIINSSDSGVASLVGGNLQINLTSFGGGRIRFTGLTQINVTDITF